MSHKQALFIFTFFLLEIALLVYGNLRVTVSPVSIVHHAIAVEPSPIPETIEQKITRAWGEVEGERAKDVAFCESSLDPLNRSNKSTAKGLFQILDGTWEDHKCTGDALNPDDNIACAYKIYQKYGWDSTASWRASRPCWRGK